MEFPRLDNIRLNDNSNPLRFQIFDWYIPEDDKSLKHVQANMRKKGLQVEYPDEASEYEMLMFGSTEEGNTVCAKVKDFKPYFYVKIPNKFANKPSLSNWVNEFYEYLMHSSYQDARHKYEKPIISKRYKDHLVSVKLVKRKEFYGFTNNKDFYFMKITVKSLNLFNSLRYFFKSPPQEFQKKYNDEKFVLYESGLTPFLRFIHLQDIKPCGWVELPANTYDLIANSCDDDSYSKANFIVETNYKNVLPYESNKTSPILIASFDIECTSSHGDFPVAIKDYSKLVNDLFTIAKNCDFTKQQIYEGMIEAYNNDVDIGKETIHRLYSKSANIDIKKLNKIIDEIYDNMKRISNNENKDIENDCKNNILRLLNKYLPKLEGDQIIQIGTSVHRYGSSDIIYKNIISLKSCDQIEGVDVKCCNDETELLIRWKALIQELSPDILMGYNIFGFDFPYIWDRANELGIDEYGTGFGRLTERNCQLLEQKLSSSALGDNFMYYIDMDGIVLVDLLKVMQRDHKLDSYKLDNVAKVFIGDKKNDLKPNEIFSKFKGTSYDRKVIAEYCIQDCCLVNQLFHKLKILENNVGMGNVCSVPLSYLFMRGQGIKIFSLVANECRKNNYVIPDLKNYIENTEDEVGYEGAIVLVPQPGMYLDDYIVTLDFASLYPSSMIERNLSHDCYVNDPEYDNLPNVEYKTIEYDIYEGKGDDKRVVGKQSCKFVQLPNNEKGIIPRILQYLLKQRKVTRKKMEYETLYTEDASYSGMLKEETDDLYKLYDIENDKYYTIMKKDVIKRKETYDPFEQAVLDALQLAYKVTANSLYGQIGARTSQIYLKEIAACTTATGRERILHAKEFVETEYGAEVIYGDSVTSYTPITLRVKGNLVVDKIEDISSKYGNNNWIPCIEEGKQEKESCEIPEYVEVWSDKGWTPITRVIRHVLAEHKKIIRVLTHTGVVDVTDDHSLLLSNGDIISPKDIDIGTKLLHKEIPLNIDDDVLKSSTISKSLIDLLLCNNSNKALLNIEETELKSLQIIYLLTISLGYKVIIDTSKYDKNRISITLTNNFNCINDNVVKAKYEVPYKGYVYDLTTSNHHFQAGVGQMIVHNTDSIFCRFKKVDENGKVLKDLEGLKFAITQGQIASNDINKVLPPPQNLEYEKTFYPFIIFSKKRYVGNLYEEDAYKKPKQKSMGIVLKRRDNAPIVKKIYGGIIDILLNEKDLQKSVKFLDTELKKLVNSEYPLEDLIISKTLSSTYKNPESCAHKMLADRMTLRDPGNKPQVNDRIPFVYIKTPPDKEIKFQGERIEHPDYIRENNLIPDYEFYITNQLLRPITQLYSLCLEELPNYDRHRDYWKEVDEKLKLKPIYQDETKRANYTQVLKEREVEYLLFNEYITKKTKRCSVTDEPKSKTTNVKKNKIIQKHSLDEENCVKLTFKLSEKKNNNNRVVYESVSECNDKVYIETILKGKKTKSEGCTETLNMTLKKVLNDYKDLISEYGIQIKLDMPRYRNQLLSSFEEYDNLQDNCEKAEKALDIGEVMEQQERMRIMIIAALLTSSGVKYQII